MTSIRNQLDYSPQAIYWIGGQMVDNEFKWLDGTNITFKVNISPYQVNLSRPTFGNAPFVPFCCCALQGWVPGQEPNTRDMREQHCLGLQWKMSPTKMLPSGLFWSAQPCTKFGGYSCKKKSEKATFENGKNYTVTGLEGEFTSPSECSHHPAAFWCSATQQSNAILLFQTFPNTIR